MLVLCNVDFFPNSRLGFSAFQLALTAQHHQIVTLFTQALDRTTSSHRHLDVCHHTRLEWEAQTRCLVCCFTKSTTAVFSF